MSTLAINTNFPHRPRQEMVIQNRINITHQQLALQRHRIEQLAFTKNYPLYAIQDLKNEDEINNRYTDSTITTTTAADRNNNNDSNNTNTTATNSNTNLNNINNDKPSTPPQICSLDPEIYLSWQTTFSRDHFYKDLVAIHAERERECKNRELVISRLEEEIKRDLELLNNLLLQQVTQAQYSGPGNNGHGGHDSSAHNVRVAMNLGPHGQQQRMVVPPSSHPNHTNHNNQNSNQNNNNNHSSNNIIAQTQHSITVAVNPEQNTSHLTILSGQDGSHARTQSA